MEKLHLCFTDKIKKYGNVFSFKAGSSYTIVLNGHEVIREALVKRAADFAGRSRIYVEQEVFNKEKRGVVMKPYGEVYKKNRAHSMNILKEFGYGNRAVMEGKIHAQLVELVKYIEEKNGVTWNPSHILQLTSLHTMLRITFSENRLYEDEDSECLRSMLATQVDCLNPLYDIFPFLAYVPPFSGQLEKLRPIAEQLHKYLMKKIDESIRRCDDDDNFVQHYIKTLHGSGYEPNELEFILRDIFVAGSETVAGQLCWALTLIGNRPEIMKRLQRDIDAVVPKDRLPSLFDKPNLPYVEATILEMLRFRTAIPLSVPHSTTCDTSAAGYDIPKDTTVLINLWSAHMDPLVWRDPEIFRPERFLDEHDNIINQELMITFLLGKRSCLGETLARQELFIFLTGILQQFTVLPPEGQSSIREEIQVVRILSPAPYELRLVTR